MCKCKPNKAEYEAAGNISTSFNDLVILSQNEHPAVRSRVAENPSCPLYLLAFLVQDVSGEVRISVASNPKATRTLLEWLSHDSCPDVRFALGEDHNLPQEILEVLMRDENPYVAQRARNTMTRIQQSRFSSNVCQISSTTAFEKVS